jgi:hypothetical protein
MSYVLIALVLVLLSAVVLVMDVLRNPARCAPCSHVDDFAPRWRDGGANRWSV